MAERTTVARPYADAAFDYAHGADALPKWAEMLHLAEQMAGDPRMADAMSSPRLTSEAKTSLFLSVGGDRLDEPMRNFLRILIEADRIGLMPEIRALFDARRDDAEGVAKATIESAIALDEAQVRDLTAALTKRFGRTIEATVEVKPELVGGARITVGDTVIDGSVKAKLEAMSKALRA